MSPWRRFSRSATERAAWKTLVDSYLDGRQALAGVVVLVDLRRGVESEEAELVGPGVPGCARERRASSAG